jgi:plastocyanin
MIKQRLMTCLSILILGLAVACGGGSDSAPADDHGGSTTPPAKTAEPPAPTTGATGSATIAGTINFEGSVPKLRPLQMDADPGCAKKHTEDVMPEILVLGEGKSLANVLVYVTGGLTGGATYPAPTEAASLDQHGCQYSPHVISLQTGQPFKILNSDGLLHNVHGLPKDNQGFNKAMPAAVTEANFSFDKQEIFKVKCDVHPWMGAWIGVFSHPFHAVTGMDGSFSLTGLPAGTYDIEALHEKLGTLTAQITVEDGATATNDFTFAK